VSEGRHATYAHGCPSGSLIRADSAGAEVACEAPFSRHALCADLSRSALARRASRSTHFPPCAVAGSIDIGGGWSTVGTGTDGHTQERTRRRRPPVRRPRRVCFSSDGRHAPYAPTAREAGDEAGPVRDLVVVVHLGDGLMGNGRKTRPASGMSRPLTATRWRAGSGLASGLHGGRRSVRASSPTPMGTGAPRRCKSAAAPRSSRTPCGTTLPGIKGCDGGGNPPVTPHPGPPATPMHLRSVL